MYAYEADPLVSEEIYQEDNSAEVLAMELLAVTDEQELDQFLGKLIGGVSKALKSPLGRALLTAVKPVARTFVRAVIPKAATLVGSAIGGPLGGLAGAGVGAGLNALAGKLGLEIEGMSQEDQTFEVAKAVVNYVKKAATNLATVAQQAGVDPVRYARNAAISAARQTAPGVVPILAAGIRTAGNGASAAAISPRIVRVAPNRWMIELE